MTTAIAFKLIFSFLWIWYWALQIHEGVYTKQLKSDVDEETKNTWGYTLATWILVSAFFGFLISVLILIWTF